MQLSEIQPGQELTWLHEPRGGYGYVIPVNAKVIKLGPKKVQVEVMTAGRDDSFMKLIWVSPDKLKVRKSE